VSKASEDFAGAGQAGHDHQLVARQVEVDILEIVLARAEKGSEVYIEGQLETRKWQDQSGADKYTTEIVLRQFRGELSLIGGRASGGGDAGEEREYGGAAKSSGYGERSSAPARSGAPKSGGWDSGKKADMDDDIPF
jgi:single-strand DNA-binding protein